MIRFISGPARAGKSTLYRQLIPQLPGDKIELDPVLTALIDFKQPKPGDPLTNGFDVDSLRYDDWLSNLVAMDEAWWPFIEKWVREHSNYGSDVLFVGILWPHLLEKLDVPHRAVFLVDTDESHIERAIEIAAGDHFNNWQAGWPEDKIRKWGFYNVERARFFKAEALARGYSVFDVAELGYCESQRLATEALLAGE